MLTVENVDLFYGASQALRGVSIGATKGAVTCLLGRNGVGKTSLLRAIFGLQPIRGGRIEWDGTDLTALAPHQRARHGLALVPQGREIFPASPCWRTCRPASPRCRAARAWCPTRSTRSSRC